MLKIVHCFTDQKFVKGAINEFEILNNFCENKYVYVQSQHKKTFEYIGDIKNIEYLQQTHFLKYIIEEECNVVILHNLYSLPLNLILKIPPKIKVVWFAWGFDLYRPVGSRPFFTIPNLYHPETQKLLKKNLKENIIQIKTNVRKFIRDGKVKEAVNRVDFFSGIIPEEYEMMKRLPYFHAKQVDFRYGRVEGIDFSLLDKIEPIKGKDILIGNSGDPTNNHADIFMKLKNIDLTGRKIIVPLSYAGSIRYKQKVKLLGKKLWGDDFVAVEDFMPYTEYKRVLSSCGYRIFGHERQQAMGNIRISFMDGCKVFLSETSIVYKHYMTSGLKMFTIQHDLNEENLSQLLNDEDTYRNRKIAIEESLSSQQIERLHKMINVLENT